MSSSLHGFRTPSTPLYPDTYQIVRSSPYTEKEWAEASDADAPADEWDNDEYDRQMKVHLMQKYAKSCLMDLRRMCKGRKLRVRGNKSELMERLARDDIMKM